MSLLRNLFERAASAVIRRATRRMPDFVVGSTDNPYLKRWWLIPHNPVLNIYVHKFLRDDDDRALHDHPWAWCSILLRGCYIEHTIAAGGVHHRQVRFAPSIKVSGPWRAHRIELARSVTIDGPMPRPCWTLFITGPRMRAWGFHCAERGWVHFRRFTNPSNTGETGAGCEG